MHIVTDKPMHPELRQWLDGLRSEYAITNGLDGLALEIREKEVDVARLAMRVREIVVEEGGTEKQRRVSSDPVRVLDDRMWRIEREIHDLKARQRKELQSDDRDIPPRLPGHDLGVEVMRAMSLVHELGLEVPAIFRPGSSRATASEMWAAVGAINEYAAAEKSGRA